MVISVPEGYAARFAALVALLVKMPRTVKEIQTALGYGDRRSVEMLIHHLRGEGLVYLKEWRQAHRYAKLQAVYAWQPSICEHADTPPPMVARRGVTHHNRDSAETKGKSPKDTESKDAGEGFAATRCTSIFNLTRKPIHETDPCDDA